MVKLEKYERELLIVTLESQIELLGDNIAEWEHDQEMQLWVKSQISDQFTLREILAKLQGNREND